MERFIINKKDLTELVKAKRRVATIDRKKRMRFIEAAFGALKGDYGNGSSVEYVTKLRNDDSNVRIKKLRCTPLSRQFETKIKIVCYRYEPKYTDAGV